MRLTFLLLLGAALSGFTYVYLERMGRRAWQAMACRTLAWGALFALVADLSCGNAGARGLRPLVLLDASLSLRAAGGRWAQAVDSAERWGEVRLFGDERSSQDTGLARGRSLLTPGLIAASASGRPLIVVTDGEIEDAGDPPADLLRSAEVRFFPRAPVPDVAVIEVAGPERVTLGDSVVLEAALRSVGTIGTDTVRLEVRGEKGVVARGKARLSGGGALVRFAFSSAQLAAGAHLLEVGLVGARDAEPRDDLRWHLLVVTPTPGVVVLANPGDWDSRYLYRTLKEVAQLPVRGYASLDAGHWRSMADLAPVPLEEVRQAARNADLLVAKGEVGEPARNPRARGRWLWPSGEQGESVVPGDWYLSVTAGSPLTGAFVGQPVDSFPPAIQITPMEPGPRDWVALTAQEGRRGAGRPVVIGRDSAGIRRVTVAADGLWRWAMRGGSSEEAYRAWVAATASWLLGGADSARGRARPIRAVVQNSRPLVFQWLGTGVPSAIPVDIEAASGAARRDTLRFDGGGGAQLWLPVGRYRYRLEGGGEGVIAVESYSDEWLPRTPALREQKAAAVLAGGRTNARQWLWLFGLCVAGFSGEWWARKRLGLR